MMSGAFSLVNVLADSLGPGTVGFNDEPQDFFMVSAFSCLAMILLHTCWGVITFDALDRRRWLNLAFVWVSHILVSCMVSSNFYEKDRKTRKNALKNIFSDSVERNLLLCGNLGADVPGLGRRIRDGVQACRRKIRQDCRLLEVLQTATSSGRGPSQQLKTIIHLSPDHSNLN